MKNFKRMMSLALALIMVVALGACGGDGGKTNKEVKDTVNLSLTTAIDTTDPMANTKDQNMQTFQWVYESLIFADGDANITPALAESWEVKNDGKDYVFKIRQGVKFHSGNAMTMEDVVFSMQRNCEMSFMKNYNSAIDSVEQTGDWELTIHLKAANNGFLYNLFNLKVVEKAIVEKEGENFGNSATLAGTGPYFYKSYDPNTLIVFEKFADYWNKDKVGNIKTINAHVITNATTRVTAFQTGELDFIPVPTASWEQIKSSGKYQTLQAEGTNVCTVIVTWYNEGTPLHDKRVRQALRYAIDTENLIKAAASGLGTKADVICNPTYVAGSTLDDQLKNSFPYDLEKAKALLKEAGYPNGVDVGLFLIPNKNDNEKVSQVLKSMWEKAGITCTLELAESSTASTRSKTDEQALYITVSNYVHHMSNQKRAIHSSTIKTQVAKYNSPELDSYLDNAETALTDKERDEWYMKANKFMDDFAVNIPLYYQDKVYAWDKALDAPISTYYLYVQDWNWT